MNRELILKYKAEFDHWVHEGKLLQKEINLIKEQNWTSFEGDWDWPIDELVIVIDDEYVDFRKAMAEGKIIQQQDYYSKEWIDMKTDKFHGASDTQYEGIYRIKPEEPKFKVGDWVKTSSGVTHIIDTSEGLKANNATNLLDCTPWEPQPGEWCWFWDISTLKNKYRFPPKLGQYGRYDFFLDYYNYCEPFTGELPTIIKD